MQEPKFKKFLAEVKCVGEIAPVPFWNTLFIVRPDSYALNIIVLHNS